MCFLSTIIHFTFSYHYKELISHEVATEVFIVTEAFPDHWLHTNQKQIEANVVAVRENIISIFQGDNQYVTLFA